MRRSPLTLLVALVVAVLSVAAGPEPGPPADDDDPFPVGACVHAPTVHGKPLCVLVDPTE